MADDQTIRELETTDDYLAQLISFLNNRVEALENDPTTINSAIQSLSARIEDLQHFHISTLDTVTIWLAGFAIIITILIAGAGAIAGYLIIDQKKDLKELQEKGMAEVREEMMRNLADNRDADGSAGSDNDSPVKKQE